MDYIPTRTLSRFHASSAFGRYVVGPVGSGKSTGAIMELMLTAAQQLPASDSRRYTRMAIVRNTLQQLRTTVLPDVLQLLRGAAEYHVTSNTIRIRTREVHSDWLLMPLDTQDDQRRLLSTQLTMVWVNEFREVPQPLIASIAGRVGRYPSKAVLPTGPTRYGIIADSNPYADGSEWHTFLELEPRADHVLFRQPSGLSPEAENVENLVPGYYQRLAADHSADWVKVHVHGLNGDDQAGLAVFRSSFDYTRHVTMEPIAVNPHRPLVIGLDLGRTPTALICQTDARGRMLVIEEVAAVDMGLPQFLREKLRPVLTGEPYAGLRAIIIVDPAACHKSQLSEQNAYDVLREEGFLAAPAVTNDIGPRLRAVEKLLLESRGAVSALLIDGTRCPMLVTAMRMNYRYRRRQNGAVDDTPDKTHPWSDLADALQYACLGATSSVIGRILARGQHPSARQMAPPVGSWT